MFLFLTKGGDYTVDTMLGAREVPESRGKAELIPFLPGNSSSAIIDKIKRS